jgi:hypothetical protein
MKNNFWPYTTIIRFKSDNNYVENLIVYVVLLSKLKNDFTIGPLFTNDKGEIQITNEDMRATIENAKKAFPMDYNGTLEDCEGLAVIVETIDELSKRILVGREFYPNEAHKLEEQIKNCSNGKYLGKKVVYKKPAELEIIEIKSVVSG